MTRRQRPSRAAHPLLTRICAAQSLEELAAEAEAARQAKEARESARQSARKEREEAKRRDEAERAAQGLPVPKKGVRGKQGKLKKVREKYADQDAEERRLRMAALGHKVEPTPAAAATAEEGETATALQDGAAESEPLLPACGDGADDRTAEEQARIRAQRRQRKQEKAKEEREVRQVGGGQRGCAPASARSPRAPRRSCGKKTLR